VAPSDDSNESVATPDDPQDLPGELLGEDLVEPEPYEVAADETEAEELDQSGVTGQTVADEDAPVEIDDPAQLSAAETVAQKARSSRPVRSGDTAAQKARSSRPVRKSTVASTTTPKGAPTPARKRGSQAVADRPSGPIEFVGESVEELKKVVWPTWSQVQQYFWAVLVFVLIVITYVGLLDLGFGWVLLKLFGAG